LVTAGKYINNTWAIARTLLNKRVLAATVKVLLDYNNANGISYVIHEKIL
jgi:hypothetical protein